MIAGSKLVAAHCDGRRQDRKYSLKNECDFANVKRLRQNATKEKY